MNEVNARRARLVLGWVTSRQILATPLDGHVGATAAEKLEGTSRGADADPIPFLLLCPFPSPLTAPSMSHPFPSPHSSFLLALNSARRSGEALKVSHSKKR